MDYDFRKEDESARSIPPVCPVLRDLYKAAESKSDPYL